MHSWAYNGVVCWIRVGRPVLGTAHHAGCPTPTASLSVCLTPEASHHLGQTRQNFQPSTIQANSTTRPSSSRSSTSPIAPVATSPRPTDRPPWTSASSPTPTCPSSSTPTSRTCPRTTSSSTTSTTRSPGPSSALSPSTSRARPRGPTTTLRLSAMSSPRWRRSPPTASPTATSPA